MDSYGYEGSPEYWKEKFISMENIANRLRAELSSLKSELELCHSVVQKRDAELEQVKKEKSDITQLLHLTEKERDILRDSRLSDPLLEVTFKDLKEELATERRALEWASSEMKLQNFETLNLEHLTADEIRQKAREK